MTEQRNLANRAREDANRRLTEAQEVVDFLITDMIGAAAPSQTQGELPTVDQVLAQADQQIGEEFADRPLIEASIRHALANAYEELGQLEKAERHAVRGVALRQQHLGHRHVETIAVQNALGLVFYRRGKHAEGRDLMTKVLANARQVLGSEHEETLRAMNNLVAVLDKLQQDDEDLALVEELLSIRMHVLGPEHRDTLIAMHNVAFMYEMFGKDEKAKQIYKQALEISSRALPNDPVTFLVTDHLARNYGRLEEHDHELDLRRRTLEGRLRVLPLEHTHTQKAIHELVNAFVDQGKLDEAETLGSEMVERSRRELGPDAPETVTRMGDLARIRFLQGNGQGALDLLQHALATVERLPEGTAFDLLERLAQEFGTDPISLPRLPVASCCSTRRSMTRTSPDCTMRPILSFCGLTIRSSRPMMAVT